MSHGRARFRTTVVRAIQYFEGKTKPIIQEIRKKGSNISGLTCLWDSGAIVRKIKRRHTKYYERNMRYNKVEYRTASGLYCMTHDVMVPFCMP